ncbi:hypothetical protein A0H76_1319 [Hepatospora eriocheir]|uniref:Uncharacterized protein n=1 Tax=Hepatospora eriocheir TaxID=1081669 RepID=A0A1X0QHA0_9MICR|nr:hypothetical protein A0H76_1319 [Hepatospora eriocheir]
MENKIEIKTEFTDQEIEKFIKIFNSKKCFNKHGQDNLKSKYERKILKNLVVKEFGENYDYMKLWEKYNELLKRYVELFKEVCLELKDTSISNDFKFYNAFDQYFDKSSLFHPDRINKNDINQLVINYYLNYYNKKKKDNSFNLMYESIKEYVDNNREVSFLDIYMRRKQELFKKESKKNEEVKLNEINLKEDLIEVVDNKKIKSEYKNDKELIKIDKCLNELICMKSEMKLIDKSIEKLIDKVKEFKEKQ